MLTNRDLALKTCFFFAIKKSSTGNIPEQFNFFMMHDMTVCLVLLNCFDEINQTSYVLTSVFVQKYPSACAR